MAGGFIWDFADQSIRKVDGDGVEKWLYGGDFDEEDTHRYFVPMELLQLTGHFIRQYMK